MMFSTEEPMFPDLSLKISPPSMFSDVETIKEPATSISDSGGSGSELSLGFNVSKPGPFVKKEGSDRLSPKQHNYSYKPRVLGRDFKRGGLQRSARAPRMRWTTTLHSHFVHVVQLLGGHERATPKSVLELMNVNDLTLAHVKSHLQMYRTVKSTDKGSAGGQVHVQSHVANKQRREEITETCDQKRTEATAEASHGDADDTSPSYLKPTSLLSNPHKGGYSWLLSTETTTATSELQHLNGVKICHPIDCKVDGQLPALQYHVMSKDDQGRSATLTLLESSSCLSSDSDHHQVPLLDLGFTLGRPSWRSDHPESPNELTLLNC